MGKGYLMDSNTVIDFLGGKLPEKGKNFLLGVEPIISVITEIELFSSKKILQEDALQIKTFVAEAIVYNTLNAEIVSHTIDIRKTHSIKLPDAVIASTALTYNLTLVTRNIKDFKGIKGLEVLNPYEI